jgi:hypothetical protein
MAFFIASPRSLRELKDEKQAPLFAQGFLFVKALFHMEASTYSCLTSFFQLINIVGKLPSISQDLSDETSKTIFSTHRVDSNFAGDQPNTDPGTETNFGS